MTALQRPLEFTTQRLINRCNGVRLRIDENNVRLSFNELSRTTALSSVVIIEIVARGIVGPIGEPSSNWRFSMQTAA